MICMENIYELKEKIMSSPIRQCLDDDINIPFKELISEQLYKSIERFNSIQDNKNKPLNIVIMGEVKSGKSSLINALLQSKVSEVDVLESTSNIIETVFGKEDYIKEDNDITQIVLNNEYLKNINIVDTPGLKSITINNEKITLDYIKNAELILFVMDATHLGQEDIIDALDIIYEYNIPIIGVINKCDLLESNNRNILNFVKDEYGIYIDEFFMISAYLEYQDSISKNSVAKKNDLVISKNTDLRKEFERLNDYIKNLSEESKDIKESSINSSLDSIIQKEIIIHYDYLKSISILIEQFNQYEEILENKSDYMNFKMDFEINDWINRVFFDEEINRIKDNIENSKIYINESYINDIINSKKIELDEIFFKEWNECLKEVSESLDEDIKKYIDKVSYRSEYVDTPNLDITYNKIDFNEMLATIGTGAILGATSGGILSIYSAGISASAASITLSSALMTYCPPLLIAGTLTGALAKIINDKVNNDKKSREILDSIDIFIGEIKDKTVEELKNAYNNNSREIVLNTVQILKNIKHIFLSKYELKDLVDKVDKYIKILQENINN